MYILFCSLAQIFSVPQSYFSMQVDSVFTSVLYCSFSITDMVGRIMAPKDFHLITLRTSESVTLHCKRDFLNVIKLRILRWGDDPGLSGWVKDHHFIRFNHKDPQSDTGRQGVKVRKRFEERKWPRSKERQSLKKAKKFVLIFVQNLWKFHPHLDFSPG